MNGLAFTVLWLYHVIFDCYPIFRTAPQQEAIRRVLHSDIKNSKLKQNLDVLKFMDNVLLKITDVLFGEIYVTISALLPFIKLPSNKMKLMIPN